MLTLDFLLLRRLRFRIDLIPGPPHNDEAHYNQAIQVIVRYPAKQVAASLSALQGITTIDRTSEEPDGWHWTWEEDDRSMGVEFSLLKDELPGGGGEEYEDARGPWWGGSTLDLDCYLGDLIGFYTHFRRKHPDVWLHYDGRVYTASSLTDKIKQMIEDEIITDIV